MKCVKEIEPPFLSSVLKGIESKIDICSILNEKKDKRKHWKQKADMEQPNVTATSKKTKRARDETSQNEEWIEKIERSKTMTEMDCLEKLNKIKDP